MIKEVIKGIISPKAVKRANNMEALELLDGEEDNGGPGQNESGDEEDKSIFDIDLLKGVYIPTALKCNHQSKE